VTLLFAASLVLAAVTAWWLVRRWRLGRLMRVSATRGSHTLVRGASRRLEFVSYRCQACNAAVIEDDSAFCPRCGTELTGPY
jgi:uncharacterized paraquat-inducible protein A